MPKKPKKEKVNETPEEKMARLKKEAQEAEERTKLQMDANRASLQARREREQQYSKLNCVKIHNQWRKIMRMSKVEELRGQIEVLSQSHEREVDRKDAIIQMLDRDLEDAESQFESAVQGNFQVVSQLLDLQYQRLKAVDEDFSTKMKALDEEFSAERVEIAASHARHKKDMNDIIASMQSQFSEFEADLRQEYEAAREDIKNKNTEDLNVMKITLESTIDELEKKFEISHEAYLMQTSEHMTTFNALTKTDAQAARVIDMRMRKLQKLQDQLKHWRSKISSNSQEWEARNASLLAEKKAISRHYQSLKSAMDSFRGSRSERLKQLSLQAQSAEQDLNEVVQKAEGLLKLAEMCRRLETEQEKILPFVPVNEAVKFPEETSPADEIEAELARLHAEKQPQPDSKGRDGGSDAAAPNADGAQGGTDAVDIGAGMEPGPNDVAVQVNEEGEELGDPKNELSMAQLHDLQAPKGSGGDEKAADASIEHLGEDNAPACVLILAVHADGTSARGLHDDDRLVQDHEYFDKFFLRYNKVLLDTMAVDREKKRLEQENEDLRTILKQYLDGISVNADVMNNPLNPLMVVNQRLQLILQERDKARAMALKQQATASY